MYKNIILQDLCSTVTVNKHTIKHQESLLLFWKYFQFWQWLIRIHCCTNFNLLSLMLHFVLLSFSLFSIFQVSSTVFAFLGLNIVGSSLTFSVLLSLLCYFNILFFMAQCLFSVNSIYFANKLG